MSDDRIPVDLIGVVVRRLAEGRDVTIKIREGLEIETRPDADPVIRADGQTHELKALPVEIEDEILRAAKEHSDVIEGLMASKYLDPSTNPLIKTEE